MEWYRPTKPRRRAGGAGRRGRDAYAFASGDLWFDTLGPVVVSRARRLAQDPRRGGGQALGGDASFNRAAVTWQLAIPVHRRATFGGDAFFRGYDARTRTAPLQLLHRGMNSYNVFQGNRTSSFLRLPSPGAFGTERLMAGLHLQVETVEPLVRSSRA